jgi:lysozyme
MSYRNKVYSQINPKFIKDWEGFDEVAYWDSYGKIWTIGNGLTMINGRPVRKGDKLSQSEADRLFYKDVFKRIEFVKKSISPYKPSKNQLTALVSLSFNIGLGAFDTSTIAKKLRKGETDLKANRQAHDDRVLDVIDRKGVKELSYFTPYGISQGKAVWGLIRRRVAEHKLFSKNTFNFQFADATGGSNIGKILILGVGIGAIIHHSKKQ